MGRDPKPTKSKEAKPPVARKSPEDEGAKVGDLEKRLEEALKGKAEALGQLQTRDRELAESREQQAATAEILRVISSSPSDVQPVFEAIVSSAKQLVGAYSAAVLRLINGELHLVASSATTPLGDEAFRAMYPLPLTQAPVLAQAIRDRAPLLIEDTETDPRITPLSREMARQRGYRSTVSMPLVQRDGVIGVIGTSHAEPRTFSSDELALLQTFADQAVIAIENVRLFTELETSNRELTTALDTQTATSDILRVISCSQTDVQPVFDAIVISARRLLRGYSSGLTRVVGDQIELAALTSTDAGGDAALRARFPLSLQSDDPHAQAIRDRATFNAADFQVDPRVPEAWRVIGRARGWRSGAVVPMLRHEEVLGTIAVTRREPGGFADDEIALLQTFADQAVIALENVRLFNETKEALEQQTAAGEILRVIARSPTDVQPVFDAIVGMGARLCEADFAMLARYDGTSLSLAAHSRATNDEIDAVGQVYPMVPTPG